MSHAYERAQMGLADSPRRWLITGVAGFIGSHLLEALLRLDQEVVGLDNFSTGRRTNLVEVQQNVGPERWSRFRFIEGDIRHLDTCIAAANGVDVVLHEAALGSVPRSIADPAQTNEVNISGTLNVLIACRDAKVRRLVYAASSSTYGDHPALPKVEDVIGRPLSPYAVTKFVNELYADVFSRCYGVRSIGLRYFNVFGARQDPNGAYAAVIPRWVRAMLRGDPTRIYGDGETSRDFCYVENVVQANLLAAMTNERDAMDQVYNVAVGQQTTLNELHRMLSAILSQYDPSLHAATVQYEDFRDGDVRHSRASIDKARRLLMYEPSHSIKDGIALAVPWYLATRDT